MKRVPALIAGLILCLTLLPPAGAHADPTAPRNFPQPMPLTKAQRDADEARRDAGGFGDVSKYGQMTIEEARVFLGW